jgi:hypothetical protein
MINAANKANEQFCAQITTHMLDVYNDAKRGTLSAWSWPSKLLTRFVASRQSIHNVFEPYEPKLEEMQYVNPTHHRNCLRYIAE